MEKLYEIKEAMLRELEKSKTAKSGELQAGEIDALHKLTDTIKNIDKICILEEEGYSEDGYGRGVSNANRGQHYVRGHYSRDGGMGGNDGYSSRGGSRDGRGRYSRNGGYSRDGYSREDGRSEMMEHLEKALDSADENDREMIRRMMKQIENA